MEINETASISTTVKSQADQYRLLVQFLSLDRILFFFDGQLFHVK